jgi:mono/diheme cytochrome c family protein
VRKLALIAAAGLAVTACDPDRGVHLVGWFATMRTPRSVRPYTMPLMPAPGSVPITGSDPDSLSAADAERLSNPRTRTAESLNRGQWVYETYCLVCHGPAGRGDGPISALNGRTPPGPFPGIASFHTPQALARSDGYIYGVVTYAQAMGRGLMPRYGDKVHGTDRWDVINYVRYLQAQAAGGGQ